MKGTLKRLENAMAVRDDTIDGQFWSWPRVGKSFVFFKFHNGGMRVIETARVTKIVQRGGSEMVFAVGDGVFRIVLTGNN